MGMDTVVIVLEWEETFGLTLSNEEVEILETPRMAIDLLCKKLKIDPTDQRQAMPCPSMRAFHIVRHGLLNALGRNSTDRRIKLSSSLRKLAHGRRRFWQAFRAENGCGKLTVPCLCFGPVTVRDLVFDLVQSGIHHLRLPDEPWTREWFKEGVRASVRNLVGQRPFKDDDHFIQDIGLQ